MQTIEKLVITGSNGFVGQSLLRYLDALGANERPQKIITLNRSDYSKEVLARYPSLNIEYRLENLEQTWDFKISDAHLINLAADGSAKAYSQDASNLFMRIGKNCADWIKQNEPLKVFHASSGASFGVLPLETDSEFRTDHGASVAKQKFIESRLAVENTLTALGKELGSDIAIGRLFSFIGPNILKKDQYAVTSFIKGAVEQNSIKVNGNPSTVRSYLHETDLSLWILRSLELANLVTTVSIGSSIKVTISELAEFIATATGAKIEYLNPNAPGDVYSADNAATLESLGVTETKNWQDAVIECIEIVKGKKN
jgi:dTDP-glucose 4,6-dehydratase